MDGPGDGDGDPRDRQSEDEEDDDDDANSRQEDDIPTWSTVGAAVRRRESLPVIRTLVQRMLAAGTSTTSATSSRKHGGSVLLRMLLRQKHPSFELVRYLVEQFPTSLLHRGGSRYLPLHAAVVGRAPLRIIRFLAPRGGRQ